MISMLGFPVLLAALIAYCITPFVKKIAFKVGAVDLPNERKVHKTPMPRLGGLEIYFAFTIAVLVSVPFSKDLLGILLGGTFIVVVGILDDIYQLPAKVKLLGQILSAFVLIAFDIKMEWMTNPFGDGEYIYFEYLSIPFTIFWVVAFTNITNLIDGLDGLAAGVGAIASFTTGSKVELMLSCKTLVLPNSTDESTMMPLMPAALLQMPMMLMRRAAVSSGPRTVTYGLEAVCSRESPVPCTNSPVRNKI